MLFPDGCGDDEDGADNLGMRCFSRESADEIVGGSGHRECGGKERYCGRSVARCCDTIPPLCPIVGEWMKSEGDAMFDAKRVTVRGRHQQEFDPEQDLG